MASRCYNVVDHTLFLFLLHVLTSSSPSSTYDEMGMAAAGKPAAGPGLLLSNAGVLVLLAGALWAAAQLVRWAAPGGPAWSSVSPAALRNPIPGPRGIPILGSLTWLCHPAHLAHRRLAAWAASRNALPLMALSLGSTRVVVASTPLAAQQLLASPAFADRPLNDSARQLLFARALGFSPSGPHWRRLRRIAASHLFSPARVASHEPLRQLQASRMLHAIAASSSAVLAVRPFLQQAALDSVMASVFGTRCAQLEGGEGHELAGMVREGFDLLGSFNVADHVPALQLVDPLRVRQRCARLVPRVNAFVQGIIDEQRALMQGGGVKGSSFVDVLVGLQGEEKLSDPDIIATLWEMIFRGTDTLALQCEWVLAQLVLNPGVQEKLHAEIESVAAGKEQVRDADIAKMRYLQAVVKEALRLHPVGPLLSWARLAVHDTEVAGYAVPAGTTAMVNMWAITHDPTVWADAFRFLPERHVESEGGQDIDVRGSDLRLAPFGAGRRACPGKALALATLHLWVARLVQRFHLSAHPDHPVSLDELLKLSCEMATPLAATFKERSPATAT